MSRLTIQLEPTPSTSDQDDQHVTRPAIDLAIADL
jgi:hypothetical protein